MTTAERLEALKKQINLPLNDEESGEWVAALLHMAAAIHAGVTMEHPTAEAVSDLADAAIEAMCAMSGVLDVYLRRKAIHG